MTYNKNELPIIHMQHPFLKLFACYIHKKRHLGVNSEIAKIQSYFWITGVGRLVRSIKYNYVWCKRMYGKLEPLPIERL